MKANTVYYNKTQDIITMVKSIFLLIVNNINYIFIGIFFLISFPLSSQNTIALFKTGADKIEQPKQEKTPRGGVKVNETLLQLLTPHFVRAQFAGGIGMVSVGLGRTHANRAIESAVVYGFTPKFDAPRSIHTLTHQVVWQNSDQWRGQRYDWNFFAGINTSFVISGGETFVSLPDRYPDNHYSPNAVRFYGFIGIRGTRWADSRKRINQKSLFIALNTHDQSIRYFINDPKTGYRNLFSLSFGFTVYFPVKGKAVPWHENSEKGIE